MRRNDWILAVFILMMGAMVWIERVYGPIGLAIAGVTLLATIVAVAELAAIRALWRLRPTLRQARLSLAIARETLPVALGQLRQGLQKAEAGLDSAHGAWAIMSRFGGWRGAILRVVWKRFVDKPATMPPA